MAKRVAAPSLGRVYGLWTVVSEEVFICPKIGKSLFLCVCKCGLQKKVQAKLLKSGETKSCKSCSQRKDVHVEEHYLYNIYRGIRNRTGNESCKEYPNYGGRGIKLHSSFLTFINFVTYVEANLGKRPSPKHSLDRIDNEGDYEPGNLRWADKKTQTRNRRNAAYIYCDMTGNHTHLYDLAHQMGISPEFIYRRRGEGVTTIDGIIYDAIRLKIKIAPIMNYCDVNY